MELNKQVVSILKEFKIDKDQGLLCLLGVYHGLEIESFIPESVIKAINLTKIVEKDYKTNTLNWSIPLYEGIQTAFDWVEEWRKGFRAINPERAGSLKDCITRMKKFFAANPQYRQEDVFRATQAYFRSVSSPTYLKNAHKFIYEGAGDMRSSMLLQWLENTKEDKKTITETNMKGVVK